ncbi:MAG: hypothetical protein V2J62_13305 [candidate division KSB1 bacterium]|jgi:hypothetical protein|nr:hypothetical protein [candidate division KSB1 bacterium]
MNKTLIIVSILIIALAHCSQEQIPESTTWTGLSAKDDTVMEKVFRTAGVGSADISWWAGGYIYPGGYFEIRIIDLKTEEEILKKIYRYGDEATGSKDNPRFQWWHAEEKGRISMRANRAYKMKLWGENLGEPGIGWGLWLYKFGETPRRRQHPDGNMIN